MRELPARPVWAQIRASSSTVHECLRAAARSSNSRVSIRSSSCGSWLSASAARAIENLRLEAARYLLEHGRLPIEEIARETGFGDRERMRRLLGM